MAQNPNVIYNLYKPNITEECGKDSTGDMVSLHEEITISKTEIKEELCDYEMAVNNMEFINVKEERTSSPENNIKNENLEFIKGTEQAISENLVSGDCQLSEDCLQTKQKLPKKRLHLKGSEAEWKNTLKCTLVEQGAESKKYKCSDCKYATKHKCDLEKHIHTHTNYKPFKCTYTDCKCTPGQKETCKCNTCGYTAARKYNLKMHILVNHSGKPKEYKCANCKYATHVQSSLTRHIRTHTNDRALKCTYKHCECTPEQKKTCMCNTCGYEAANQSDLNQHILVKHNEILNKYKCADCKYATHIKARLKVHVRIHTNDRPFKCTYKDCECTPEQKEICKCNTCGYAAAKKDHLNEHILVKHIGKPKKYKCADCKFATHKKSNLKAHICRHTNNRPFKCTYKNCECTPEKKETCKCNTCGYAAARKYSLDMHILVKHRGKPKKYKCVNCMYTTHRKSDLKLHIRIHTKDKPFKCTYKNCKCTPEQKETCKCNTCGYASAQKGVLKKHILAKHQKKTKRVQQIVSTQPT